VGDGKKASGFVQAICEQALRLLRLREASAGEFLGVEQGGANREESDKSLLCYDLRLMIFELRSFPARAPFPILWTRQYLSLVSSTPFQPRHEFSITFPGLAQGVAHDSLRNRRLRNNVLRDTPQKANSW
jgi:hypothetical protein